MNGSNSGRHIRGLWGTTLLAIVVIAAACVPPTPNAGVSCAWPVRADKDTLNAAYPDTGAVYFATRYTLYPGQQLVIEGQYPDARYISFITNTQFGTPVDVETDADIAPDPGGDNPFASPGAASGDDYTVTVSSDIYAGSGVNALAAGTNVGSVNTGDLIYRLYVPDSPGDWTGGVPLPELSVKNTDGTTVPIATCATHGSSPSVLQLINDFGPPTDIPAPAVPTFSRPASLGGLFANPDNAYVASILAYTPGDVVVVRGKSPTFPDTRAGDSPTLATEMRYWSMCNNEYIKPYPVSGCLADHEVPLDGSGSYTFVVSTSADRPLNATAANGVAWLEWGSTAVDNLLIMRNMLPAASFTESVFAVTPGAEASTAMGAYAPIGAYCSKATFEAGGATACGL